MKAYFYCRVAHDDSFSLEQQAAKLRRYAEQAGTPSLVLPPNMAQD